MLGVQARQSMRRLKDWSIVRKRAEAATTHCGPAHGSGEVVVAADLGAGVAGAGRGQAPMGAPRRGYDELPQRGALSVVDPHHPPCQRAALVPAVVTLIPTPNIGHLRLTLLSHADS